MPTRAPHWPSLASRSSAAEHVPLIPAYAGIQGNMRRSPRPLGPRFRGDERRFISSEDASAIIPRRRAVALDGRDDLAMPALLAPHVHRDHAVDRRDQEQDRKDPPEHE